MYCLNLLGIALELANEDPVYEDVATKFFEHFVYIGAAVNRVGDRGGGLWNEDDGFYFDVLKLPDGRCFPIDAHHHRRADPAVRHRGRRPRKRSAGFRDFRERFRWFAQYRPELLGNLADLTHRGVQTSACAWRSSIRDKLARMLEHVLDPERLLGPHGVRSVSTPARGRALRAGARRAQVHARLRAGRSRPAPCSAATRTGAGRCGSRSTSC